MAKIPQLTRADFPKLVTITTRWADNDVYQHVNNVVYFSFFDTAVNLFLLQEGLLDFQQSPSVGLVVDNQCQYFSSIKFPDEVHVGIAVEKIGHSSVVYRLGIFKNAEPSLCALGKFTHVYVDRVTQKPTGISDTMRAILGQIAKTLDLTTN